MKRTDLHYWRACCAALGWQRDDVSAWHERLITAYSEPQRAYHTLQHLEECLHLLDESTCPSPAMIEMVLWFHDAVYDPQQGGNEERSALLAIEALEPSGVEPSLAATIARMILLTKTHKAGDDPDAQCLCDIDLAILGQPPERFDEYERQIRQEYDWVPEEVYRSKRAEILAEFLNRPQIYHTECLQERFEQTARANLKRLIASLQ